MSAYTFTCPRCGLVQPFNDNLGFWTCFPHEVDLRGYYCANDACGHLVMTEKPITEWKLIDAERAALAKESP